MKENVLTDSVYMESPSDAKRQKVLLNHWKKLFNTVLCCCNFM